MNSRLHSEEEAVLAAKVIEALHLVLDPELGINIVDMGLIYSTSINDKLKEILVRMTLSSRGCPMGAAIIEGAENTLRDHFPEFTIIVELVWEPAWSYERISEEGRQQLAS